MAKKYVYIKKSIGKPYIEFAEQLNPEEYNNLGTTWQDYEQNKWVLLSGEQVAFRDEHPNASVKEVFDMELAPAPVRTLAQAKMEKIAQIEVYDRSNAVNLFYLGDIPMWLDYDKRSRLASQVDSRIKRGDTVMSKTYGNLPTVTFPLTVWQKMCSDLEVYAGDCEEQTARHKAAVNALQTIEAVDAYDYTEGYPEKLTFDLPNE